MLLKYAQSDKKTKSNASSKLQRATAAMKLSVGVPNPRVGRKVMKGVATKRNALGQHRVIAARTEERTTVDPCDNSNDSGLGFDQHLELQLAARSTVRFTDQEASWVHEHSDVKRKKLEIKLESDDANDNFGFPETMSRRERRGEEVHRLTERTGSHGEQAQPPSVAMVRSPQPRAQAIVTRRSAVPVTSQAAGSYTSRNGKTQLQIVCQPETQHRARYQTEGSRGAVKDRSGNGFPVVKLTNYNKPATLEVFIGTDVGRVQPHMFYQACRVSGKNSTPCLEKKIEGTVVIEVEFDAAKDYIITCDCVGILKERNVDVEHRFPNEQQSRNKKKSTRCRMVFRTKIVHPDGSEEWLQITSHPIVCTQPPGVPEICKKSTSSSPCTGGLELFILGKNFLKDTRVVFQQSEADSPWEQSVQPDKEFLQQTHLVCVVPPYRHTDITESVTVRLAITSSGKTSEPHTFTYTPVVQQPAGAQEVTQPCVSLVPSAVSHTGAAFPRTSLMPQGSTLVLADAASSRTTKPGMKKSHFLSLDPAPSSVGDGDAHRMMMWPTPALVPTVETPKLESKLSLDKKATSGKMMPPPGLLPIAARRASTNVHLILPDTEPVALKTELTEDGNSQGSEDVKGMDLRMKPLSTVSDLSSTQAPTLATFQRFVTGSSAAPLPTQSGTSVEKYLSNLEHSPDAKTLPMMYSTQTAEDMPRNMVEVTSPLLMYAPTERPQPADNDKLDALVNSAAASHMIPTEQTSPVPVKKMTLDSSSYNMVPSCHLNIDTSSAASVVMYDRTSPIVVKTSPHSSVLEQVLSADSRPPIAVKTAPEAHMLTPIAMKTMIDQTKPCHTSPVAMKTIVEQTDPLQIPPIAMKTMIEQPDPRQTSPIAMKTMIEQSDPRQSSPIAMKTMIEAVENHHTSPIAMKTMISQSTPDLRLTSPIAMKTIIEQPEPQLVMKTMIEQVEPRHTSPIAMKTILNSEVPVTTVEALIQQTPVQSVPAQNILTGLSAQDSQVNTMVQSSLRNLPEDSQGTAASSSMDSLVHTALSSLSRNSQVTSANSAQLNTLVQSLNTLPENSQVTSATGVQLSTFVQSALNNLPQDSRVTSADNAQLNTLVQSALNTLPQDSQVTTANSGHLNTLVQSLSNLPHNSRVTSADNVQLNTLVQSALNSQVTSVSSTQMNSLVQSALNSLPQESQVTSAQTLINLPQEPQIVPSNTVQMNPLVQSLNNLSQDPRVTSAENVQLNTFVESALNSQVTSANNAQLNSLVQTTLGSLTQTPQVMSADSAQMNALMNTLPPQDTTGTDSARLNALVQSTLGAEQQTVLTTAHLSVQSARLNAIAQSQQALHQQVQVPEDNTRLSLQSVVKAGESAQLNTLTQSILNSHSPQTVLVSSSGISPESTKLNTLTQSLLNNAILTPGAHPAIVTRASSGEALLNTIFASNQASQATATVIVGSATQQKSDKLQQPQKKTEEGMVPQELAQMSENDLLSYINPSTFDQGF